MTTELGRAVIGAMVAVLLALPLRARAGTAGGVAAVISAYACGPVLDRWQGWAVLVTIVAAATAVAAQVRPVRQLGYAVGATLVLSVTAMALLDWNDGWRDVRDVAGEDGAFVVAGGALIAVFAGGAVIKLALSPLAKELEATGSDLDSLVNAGLYIGWLERVLLYGFIVAGVPGAAAVVVTAKSIARFPSFAKERFAEYYLIGTLASVVIAAGVAFAARAIVGLGPLP
jgi:hypothetical protein